MSEDKIEKEVSHDPVDGEVETPVEETPAEETPEETPEVTPEEETPAVDGSEVVQVLKINGALLQNGRRLRAKG